MRRTRRVAGNGRQAEEDPCPLYTNKLMNAVVGGDDHHCQAILNMESDGNRVNFEDSESLVATEQSLFERISAILMMKYSKLFSI
jgi:hypothetical protein